MPNDTWGALARQHGAKIVLSPNITDAELAAETARQAGVIFPILADLLTGGETTAVDFGCGAGRFTGTLADAVSTAATVGFEPCRELRDEAETANPELRFYPDLSFAPVSRDWIDVLFVHGVLGEPSLNLSRVVSELLHHIAPGGLLFVVDHMADLQPAHRWWRFRPVAFYQDMFRPIEMVVVGEDRQLDAPITMLAGRKPR